MKRQSSTKNLNQSKSSLETDANRPKSPKKDRPKIIFDDNSNELKLF
jgi:hypothetical protein